MKYGFLLKKQWVASVARYDFFFLEEIMEFKKSIIYIQKLIYIINLIYKYNIIYTWISGYSYIAMGNC